MLRDAWDLHPPQFFPQNFGLKKFRPNQLEACNAALLGRQEEAVFWIKLCLTLPSAPLQARTALF